MSSHLLYRIPPRVLDQAKHVQQSFTYLWYHLRGTRCKTHGTRTTAWVEEFYIQTGTVEDRWMAKRYFLGYLQMLALFISEEQDSVSATPKPRPHDLNDPAQATLVSTAEQGKQVKNSLISTSVITHSWNCWHTGHPGGAFILGIKMERSAMYMATLTGNQTWCPKVFTLAPVPTALPLSVDVRKI